MSIALPFVTFLLCPASQSVLHWEGLCPRLGLGSAVQHRKHAVLQRKELQFSRRQEEVEGSKDVNVDLSQKLQMTSWHDLPLPGNPHMYIRTNGITTLRKYITPFIR